MNRGGYVQCDIAARIAELKDERRLLRFLGETERDRVIAGLMSELVFSLDRQISEMYADPFAPARRGAGRAASVDGD